MLKQVSCRGGLILVMKSLSPRLNLLSSTTQTQVTGQHVNIFSAPVFMLLLCAQVCFQGVSVTLWSAAAELPAGERDGTTNNITAADTRQEVEERVVRVSVTHLRDRRTGKDTGNNTG